VADYEFTQVTFAQLRKEGFQLTHGDRHPASDTWIFSTVKPACTVCVFNSYNPAKLAHLCRPTPCERGAWVTVEDFVVQQLEGT